MAFTMQDSTTICQQELGRTVCRTSDNRSAYDRARESATESQPDYYDLGARMRERREERRAQQQREIEQAEAARLRGTVIQLLVQGDCEAAVSTALRGGSIELAQQAREFCAAGPPTPPR
jgi:hypothetical protein